MNTNKITNISSPLSYNVAALLLRIGFGILMIPNHGYAKLMHFQEFKTDFVDFMGLGMEVSLGLAIFAEFFCSILIIIGLGTRLAVIPLIFTVLVILSVHNWELIGEHELATAFLIGYVAILILGPGEYSLDGLIQKKSTTVSNL
ncbi:DoxX family protein [Dyadobacter sp. 32]|uniref:DoxX family protein n=1 Tax=Dyadobacter sp. 32 TaxID=538966 RepID=UPI0011EFADB4